MEMPPNHFEEQLAHTIMASLIHEIAAWPSSEEYINNLTSRYDRLGIYDNLVRLTSWVKPYDQLLATDPTMNTNTAFVNGGLLGFRLVEEYIGVDSLQSHVGKHKPLMNTGTAIVRAESIEATAASILTHAERAYARQRIYHEFVQLWSEEVCDNPKYRHSVLQGFGLVMYLMEGVIADTAKNEDRLIMESELVALGDWDAAFRTEFPDA